MTSILRSEQIKGARKSRGNGIFRFSVTTMTTIIQFSLKIIKKMFLHSKFKCFEKIFNKKDKSIINKRVIVVIKIEILNLI
jgi:hypothetical protein